MAFWADIHCHIIPGVDDGAKDMKDLMPKWHCFLTLK